ncbi:MAG TPA: formyl transferase [Candidatus Hydrogenedentes bacterium]|nr:formyl transferase [Candidatus Hydrogenedentota bacterium]
MAKSTILLGKGTLAVRVADWFLNSPNYDLVRVVPVMPEPKWTDSLSDWAKAHGIPIVQSGHFGDIPDVEAEDWNVDLAFSVFYDKIIKAWFIDKCTRILNLHNGPLPKYRGVSPINWALKNEETLHGVTIHEITPGIDDGPIIGQVLYSIYPDVDEVITVYRRALEFGWLLFQQTMPLLDQIAPRPQDDSQATYYNAKQNDLLGERRHFTKAESV